jgi:hypothetical protein
VPDVAQAPGSFALTRGLCVLILVAMIAAVAYATWIGVLNFSRIGV